MANLEAGTRYTVHMESSVDGDTALYTCLLAMSVMFIIQMFLCVLFAYKGCKAKLSPDPPPYSPWNPFSTVLQSQQAADLFEPPPAYVTVETESRDTNDQTHAESVESSSVSQELGQESNRECATFCETQRDSSSTFQEQNNECSETIHDTTGVTHAESFVVSRVNTTEESNENLRDAPNVTEDVNGSNGITQADA